MDGVYHGRGACKPKSLNELVCFLLNFHLDGKQQVSSNAPVLLLLFGLHFQYANLTSRPQPALV